MYDHVEQQIKVKMDEISSRYRNLTDISLSTDMIQYRPTEKNYI